MLTITPAGQTHLKRIQDVRDPLLVQVLAAMPARQRTALTQSLAGLQLTLLAQPELHLARENSATASGLGGVRSA
ncbi:hypothetical protein [Streptomyces sp. NBC_00687]|uniref:hypothetical protein n=1 Tax=Streptomyces sp. NBC_00687 TaxID=2975807 RepID=UPI00225B0677|nr:hypothetical protein [Streptomyces sp. NBC_00687]MCX4918969.1 hypothetical protein [Streptomyces sp. NBC_00687]